MKKIWLIGLCVFLPLLLAACSGGVIGKPPAAPTAAPDGFEIVTAGTVNVALGKLVLSDSSSYSGSYNSVNLVDGVVDGNGFASETGASGSVKNYFLVDLDKAYTLSSVKLYPVKGEENKFPAEMTLLVSSDGSKYTKAGTYRAGKSSSSDGAVFEMTAYSIRYVKVEVNKYGNNQDRYAVGEMEVYGEIDNTENITLSKPALWMDQGAQETLTASYRVPEFAGNKIEWRSSDESIVSVDKESGVVTAKAPGDAVIYASDGKNRTECPVKVKDPAPAFKIGVYYNAAHGTVSEETIAWLSEFGLDYIEIDHGYDSKQNNIQDWLVRKAAKLGVGSVITDGMRYTVLTDSDEAILSHYAQYKNREGFMGFMIWDEPIDVAPYGRVTRLLSSLDFSAIVNVNLSPEDPGKFDEKVYAYMAAVQREGITYLTYDQYPYVAGDTSFAPNVYYSLNAMRKAGLAYHTDTGYYIQAFESAIVRKSSDSELLYNMSVGVAYGMKNFKWFTWFTPVNYFTDSILNANSQKGDMFAGGTVVNKKLHALSPYLANSDAVAVYHTDKTQFTDPLPDDFLLGIEDNGKVIVSVFRDRDTGNYRIGIVNKAFNTAENKTIKISTGSLSGLYVIDSDGNRSEAQITNGILELTFAPGDIKLIELPAGTSISVQKPENLAQNAGVFTSSSAKTDATISPYKLVDGKTNSGYWKSAAKSTDRFITILLGDTYEINETVIYSAKTAAAEGANFPTHVDIYASEDNENYTLVKSVDLNNEERPITVSFDAVKARYVKYVFADSDNQIEVGEIEIYNR